VKKTLDEKLIQKYSTNSIAVGATTYLEGNWKKKYENFFGVKLPKIKIHKDINSIQKANKYNAHSFAQGKDIYLGKDTKNLETIEGQSLLAHEITHILQQDSLDFSQKQGIDKDTVLENKAQIVEKRVIEQKGIENSNFEYFRKWDVLPQKSLNKRVKVYQDVVQRKVEKELNAKYNAYEYTKSAFSMPIGYCDLGMFNTDNNLSYGYEKGKGLGVNVETNNSVLNLNCDNTIYDGKNIDINTTLNARLNSIDTGAGLSASKEGINAKAGLMYSYAEGNIGGGLDINIPWTNYIVSPSAVLTGRAGSVGIEAEGYLGKKENNKGYGIGGSLGLSAILGGKLQFGLDFSKREQNIQRKAKSTKRTFDEDGLKDLKRVKNNYNKYVLNNKSDIGFFHKNKAIQDRINQKYTQQIKYDKKDYNVKVRSGVKGSNLYALVQLNNSRPKDIQNDGYYRVFANRALAQDRTTQAEMIAKFNKNFIFSPNKNPYYMDGNKKVSFEWHHSPNHIGKLSLIEKSLHRKNNKDLHLEDGRGGYSLFNTNPKNKSNPNEIKYKTSYFVDKFNNIKNSAYRNEKSIHAQANKYAKENIGYNKAGQKTDKIIDVENDFISHTQDFEDNKLAGSMNIASDILTMMKLNKDGRTKDARRLKTGAELLSEGAEVVDMYSQYKDIKEKPSLASYLALGAGVATLGGEIAHTTKLDKKYKFLNQNNFQKASNGLTAGADMAGGIAGIVSFAQSKDKKLSDFFHSGGLLSQGLGEGAKFLHRDMGLNVKGSKTFGHISNKMNAIGDTLEFVENTSEFITNLKNGKVDATQALNFASNTASTIKDFSKSKIGSKVANKIPFLKKFGFITKVLAFMQGANGILSSEILVTPIKFATAVATSIGSFVGTIANKVGGKVVASVVASMTAGVGALLYPVVSYFSGMLVESGIGVLYNKYVKNPIINKISAIHQAILDKGQEIPIVNFFMPLFGGDYTGFFKNFMSLIQPKEIYNFVDNYLTNKFPLVWKGIKFGARTIANGIGTVAKGIGSAISGTLEFGKDIAMTGINTVTNVAKGAINIGKKIGSGVISGVKSVGSFVGGLLGKSEKTKEIANSISEKYSGAKSLVKSFINPFKEKKQNWLETAHQSNTNVVPQTVVQTSKEETKKEKKHWWNFAKANRHQVHQTNFEQNSSSSGFDMGSIEDKLDDWAEKIYKDMKKDMQLEYVRAGRG
jgi:hypothetical protein